MLNNDNLTKNKDGKHKDSGGVSRPLGHIHIFPSQGCKVSLYSLAAQQLQKGMCKALPAQLYRVQVNKFSEFSLARGGT